MKYRAEIDGLRAIAVLAVVLYHMAVPGFDGGFIGVDVFFVISGYLITSKILDERRNGRFSFRAFYMGRIRRIFPALVATVAATFGVAAVLFSPKLLEETAVAAIAAIAAVSNILFFSQAGYFDNDAHYKALLHTWSLGVEEQFYLIWPIALMAWLSLRWKIGRWLGLGLALVAGGGIAQWGAVNHAEAAFYLMPYRAVEFVVGGAMVALHGRVPGQLRNIAVLAGLAMIAGSVATFDDKTIFPGLSALLPVLGSALVIGAGRCRLADMFLSTRPMVGIGLISYSIYLVHWPVIVFYGYANPSVGFSPLEAAGLLILTGLLAYILYRCVEVPFRYGTRRFARPANRHVAAACVASTILVLGPSLHAMGNNGWAWRYDTPFASFDASAARKSSVRLMRVAAKRPFTDAPVKVLIVGDSHAKDFFNAVTSANPYPGKIEFRQRRLLRRCLMEIDQDLDNWNDDKCRKNYRGLVSSRLLEDADVLIYAAYLGGRALRLADRLLTLPGGDDVDFSIVTRRPTFTDIPELLFRARTAEAATRMAQATVKRRWFRINKRIRRLSEREGYGVVDLTEVVCPAGLCDIVDGDRPLYHDSNHWTLAGAELFGRRLADQGFFDQLLKRYLGAAPQT